MRTDDVLTDPSFQADPHPVYAEWRRAGGVRRVTLPNGVPVWMVSDYEEARRALADPRLSKAVPGGPDVPGDFHRAISKHMLLADPPDHTRLRRLVSATFTARRIEALRPRIERITDDLLDAMAAHDRVDLIDAFAFPLPIQVICELLGIPPGDRDDFRAWSTAIVGAAYSSDERSGAVPEMVTYIRALIAERRRAPGEDLLSGLIQVRDDEDRLSEDELSSMVFLLLIAGHETTVNLIGNGVQILLEDRSRWERLRADPDLLPAAIEEFLRYEGPVQVATFRMATESFEIGGETIAQGDVVLVALLAANRDERRFPAADEVVLDRAQNPHLAFGHGIHFCLGAALARLEAQVAFTRLMARFPDLCAGETEPSWRPGLLIRGLTELPVRPYGPGSGPR